MKNINVLLPTVHCNAMVKALRLAKVFKVVSDTVAGTVEATHLPSGKSVFKALQKDGDAWIISHHPKLFI